MPCTTLLVGKKACNENSTLISRTDDGHFDEKKVIVVTPDKQPKKYKTKISHLEITLPDNPVSYTCSPSVNPEHGVWPATGINACNVAMTATETLTSNARVLGADPYVEYKKATKKGEKDVPGGIGEEDIVLLVLPYIKSAREGVVRLGALLGEYGTYEPNGIAFSDENEVWWLETIGGHHWIAQRVKDDEVVINPNQFGSDRFDLADAFGAKKENLCSPDLKEFIDSAKLDLNLDGKFNPRYVFGSRTDLDHIYNTPRGWYMARYFLPTTYKWDGENADFTPESDDIPWSFRPEKKVTVEDVKYVLSSHYQGTDYDPYSKTSKYPGKYRSIGINRTGVTSICQIRSGVPDEIKGLEWVIFGSTTFSAQLPVYTNVDALPDYISKVKLDVSTENFYWASRLIGALTDPCFASAMPLVERYQYAMACKSRQIVNEYDEKFAKTHDKALVKEANDKLSSMAKDLTTKVLNEVTLKASENMKNGYNRHDN